MKAIRLGGKRRDRKRLRWCQFTVHESLDEPYTLIVEASCGYTQTLSPSTGFTVMHEVHPMREVMRMK